MLPACFPHFPPRSPTKSGDSYWNLILKIVTFLWNIFINLHNLSGFWSLFACMCTSAREVFLKKTRVCFLRAVMTLCPATCDPGQHEFQQNVHPAPHIDKMNPVSNTHKRAAANTNEQTAITLITTNLISCLGAFIGLTANYCEDRLAAHLR